MIESEVAETLMSLSAPDERQLDNPLYASELPWQASKKRAFEASSSSSSTRTSGSAMASSLPSSSFMQPRGECYGAALSLLQHRIQERPLTSMIPGRREEHERASDDSSNDVDMDSQEESDEYAEKPRWASRSPFDGLLVAAARDQASNQDDNDQYAGNSRPISIPMRGNGHRNSSGYHNDGRPFSSSAPRFHDSSFSFGKKQKASSLSRVEERGGGGGGFLERDCSPTGVEEEDVWHDGDYKQRMRLASVCSSEGSEYGGLGRQHLEEFIRMDISAAHEGEQGMSPATGKFIGSYSPEARRKRIDRFLEKRKRRVWAKKVDYDVRKNFANSRLRVKGRFVKKEDEELLCQLMSYT